MSRIAVIGGGIAGLAASFRLIDRHDVVLFEGAERAGGKIHSQRVGPYLFEWGPSALLSSARDVRELVHDAGLDDEVRESGPATKNRAIFWNGRLHKISSKPPDIVRMTLLSPLGKLRALGDLVAAKRVQAPAGDDESVDAFVRRRFGREVAERIVGPVVLGVSGGDAKSTSMAAVFPRLTELEETTGSIVRGMFGAARSGARIYTFGTGGLQRLTDRLAERLGHRIRYGSAVTSIERDGAGWRVRSASGDERVDGVLLATPAGAAAGIVAGIDAALAAQLRTIAYAPMRVAGVAFRSEDVADPLEAFGFLAARNSGVRIIGAAYNSTIAPEQSPPGTVYLRVFLGGVADREIARLDEQTVRAIVLADLATALGITAQPLAYHDALWPDAIPQYGLRHRATVRALEALCAAHPRLALIGNAYRGLGVADTVRDAVAAAAAF